MQFTLAELVVADALVNSYPTWTDENGTNINQLAEIAVKAAQTGHMVMSTLHTNSAAETLTRLHNMGIPGFNIATSVNLIIAQRLTYLDEAALIRLLEPADEISRMLSGLISKLEERTK